MVPILLITKPFQRIPMDLIGPLLRTQRGNCFILTICDYATRYPEAIALPSTEAPRISKELVAVFARVGIPDEILSDQGTNFMSTLLEEVYRLLQVKRIRTSPYHPQTDGLVERFNGTLKMMLRKFVSRNQKDWDRLEEITELVKNNLEKAQQKQKAVYGRDVSMIGAEGSSPHRTTFRRKLTT